MKHTQAVADLFVGREGKKIGRAPIEAFIGHLLFHNLEKTDAEFGAARSSRNEKKSKKQGRPL